MKSWYFFKGLQKSKLNCKDIRTFLPTVMNHEWEFAYPVVLDVQSQHEYLTLLLSFGSRTTQRKREQ